MSPSAESAERTRYELEGNLNTIGRVGTAKRYGRNASGSDDDKVYAIGTTGANAGYLLSSYTTGAQVYASPTVYNNHVYIGSADDKLYATCHPPISGDWGRRSG